MGGLVGDSDGTNKGQILGAADGQYPCVSMNDIDGFELGVTDSLSNSAWLTDRLSDRGKDGLIYTR